MVKRQTTNGGMKLRMTRKQKVIKYWLPVFLGMALIFLLSTGTFSSTNTSWFLRTILCFLIPGISTQELVLINSFIRKLAHVVEYFMLSFLLFRAFRGGSKASFHWRWSFFTLTGVALWAAGDEFHQFFVPTPIGFPCGRGHRHSRRGAGAVCKRLGEPD